VIVHCVDIGRTIDHHYLNFLFRGDCWLCWYWWNYWPSLFKLSF